MQVDKITLHDIGLFDNNGVSGLATHLNFCKSIGGSNHFERFLMSPFNNVPKIEQQQEAVRIFIQQLPYLQKMKITNGTCLVIDKFYESRYHNLPNQPSKLEAYWYQFWNKPDFALVKYSVEHLIVFYQNLMEWCSVFEKERENLIIESLYSKIKKYITHPNLAILTKKIDTISPQEVLTLGYFFSFPYKNKTKALLDCFYELDALYSMATAHKNYQFEFPIWEQSPTPVLEMESAIHPLVPHAVGNHLHLFDQRNFLFLTGANMAGKSTFIKTIGICVYLAHLGIGVSAKKMRLSIMDGLITNLTIADNVVKGESYFFNEVQRIKNTVQKIRDGKKYCVLIDELFKGTNIQDAMKCSIEVIEGLQKLRTSVFIVSTHLYEISDSLSVYKNIQFNYFETTVQEKELHFNYHLKEGVSQDRIGYLILEKEGVVELLQQL